MKKKIVAAVCAALILIFAFSAVKLFYSEPQKEVEPVFSGEKEPDAVTETPKEPEEEVKEAPEEQKKEEPPKEEPVKEEPKKEEPKKEEPKKEEPSCTLSVRCDTALSNKDMLDSSKADILPEDGVIFPETTVYFSEGESVYDVLVREMMNAKIHMESENTPMYKSAYIEGIANLYEYDCGPLSGWMYKVNGEFPNYGCSAYVLSDGDRVEWVYTCDLGKDVGNENS